MFVQALANDGANDGQPNGPAAPALVENPLNRCFRGPAFHDRAVVGETYDISTLT